MFLSPLQVVICVDCMYWTKEMADSIVKGVLPEYSEQCTEELMKVCDWIGSVWHLH
jgi:dynein heavy chain